MTAFSRRPESDQRGVAAIEFALVFPVLIALIFGSIEFGLVIQERTVVANAAREGARAASLGGTEADVDAAALRALGSADGATITLDCVTTDGGTCDSGTVGNLAKVTVSVAYTGITGLVPALTNTHVTASSSMRIEG